MDASSKDAHCTVGREAVAWRWRGAEERWYVIAEAPDSTMCEDARLGNIELEPLFAAPSPDSAPGTGAEGMREKLLAAHDRFAALEGVDNDDLVAVLDAAATLSQPAPGQDVPEPRPAGGDRIELANGWHLLKLEGGWYIYGPEGRQCCWLCQTERFAAEFAEGLRPRPAGGEAVLREKLVYDAFMEGRKSVCGINRSYSARAWDESRAKADLALADRAEPGGREEA